MRRLTVPVLIALAAVIGVRRAGYELWGWPKDWFAARNPAALAAGPENDLIKYGHDLVVNTPQLIGPLAEKVEMRFSGNVPGLHQLPSQCRSAALCGALCFDVCHLSVDDQRSC